jgi:voltage-gated sodium channel
MQAEINADRQKAVKEAVAEGEEPLVIEVRALRAEMARLAKVIERRPG